MKTRNLAFAAIASAMVMVLLFIASMIRNEVLAMAATVIPAAVVIECGRRWGLLSGVVTAILAMLFLPDKQIALLYAGFFAYYPVLKSCAERLPKRWMEYAAKLVMMAAGAVVYLVVGRLLGMAFIEQIKWYMYIGIFAIFILYDVLLSGLIQFYMVRISKHIKNIKKN